MLNLQRYILIGLAAAIWFPATAVYASDTPEAIKLRIGKGNPVVGKAKSQLCQGCHGTTGVSVEEMVPSLAGQYSIYIDKEIRNFQVMERKHQIMNAMAAIISEADLPDIAAYFASQKQMKGNGKGDNPVGKNLFLKGDATRDIQACVTCHGENGKGLSPDVSVYPVIGGQHKAYLVQQLNNWRSGERANSPGNVMNKIAKPLTDAEIEAVASYLSSL